MATERADPQLHVDVIAERHKDVATELDGRVQRVWQRRGDWETAAINAIVRARPVLVHVQHEEAILGQDGRLLRFLRAMGEAGIKRVVTLHSVYGGRLGVPFWWPPPIFHRAIARNAEAIVVHQRQGGRDFLESQGVAPDKIHVLPHGTPSLPAMDRSAERLRLGIPDDARVALFLGVIHPKKNVHTIVAAAEIARSHLPTLRLVVAGRTRKRTIFDRIYARRLERHMDAGVQAGWLDYRRGFLPEAELRSLLAASDVVLFPHHQSYGSASGVFHLALGAGRATICSSSPKFGEAREIFAEQIPAAFARARSVAEWSRSMSTLLGSKTLCERGEELARAAAQTTAWSALGQQYAALYRDLVTKP